MFCIGIVQGFPAYADGPSHETYLFTRGERHGLVDKVGNGVHKLIKILWEHGGGENTYDINDGAGHFVAPDETVIGRVVDLLCDKEGNLIAVGEFFYEHPVVQEVIAGIRAGKKYGFSVGVDVEKIESTGHIVKKEFSHLGLTMQPAYGGDPNLAFDPALPDLDGTWLHDGAISYETIDRILAEKYLSRPGMHASKRTRDRIAAKATAKRTVALTVGASRPPSKSEPLIPTPAATLPSTAVSPPRKPPMSTNVATTGGVVVPLDVDTSVTADSTKQAAFEREKNEMRIRTLMSENKAFIESIGTSDNPEDLFKAVAIRDSIYNLFPESSMFHDPQKRIETMKTLAKMDPYIDRITERLKKHVEGQNLEAPQAKVLNHMIDNPDPLKYGPVLQSLLASEKSIGNMRQKEEELRRQLEESKKRPRDPEPETRTTAFARSDASYDQHPQSHPAEVPVKSSVAASRYNGSSTLGAEQHSTVDIQNSFFAPSIEAWKASPFSRKAFDPVAAGILHEVSAVSERYSKATTASANGIVDRF